MHSVIRLFEILWLCHCDVFEIWGLIITSVICQIVTPSFSLRHHSATPAWRNLKECVTLQPKFKMAETMIKPEICYLIFVIFLYHLCSIANYDHRNYQETAPL